MTWIRTTPLDGDDEALARARAMQRALYAFLTGALTLLATLQPGFGETRTR